MRERRGLAGTRLQGCAIDDEDVGPAIIIEIENGHAGSGGLDDVFLGDLAAENHGRGQAGFTGFVDEIGDLLCGLPAGSGGLFLSMADGQA